jgi:hypothetical protein
MNANVEGLITDHVNQLLQLSPSPSATTNNSFSEHVLYKSVSNVPVRGPRVAVREESEANISSDYRLLEKSIDKLKAM